MMKKTLIALVAASITVSAAPAFASDVAVPYADLNLASVDGQKTLERRIDRAAKKACNFDGYTVRSLIGSPESEACYDKAKASATTEMAAIVEEARLGG